MNPDTFIPVCPDSLLTMPGQGGDQSGYVRVYDFYMVSEILDLFRRNPDELNYPKLICRRGEFSMLKFR